MRDPSLARYCLLIYGYPLALMSLQSVTVLLKLAMTQKKCNFASGLSAAVSFFSVQIPISLTGEGMVLVLWLDYRCVQSLGSFALGSFALVSK